MKSSKNKRDYHKNFKRNIDIFIRQMNDENISVKNENYERLIITKKQNKIEISLLIWCFLLLFLAIYFLIEWQPIIVVLSSLLLTLLLYIEKKSRIDNKKALLEIDFKSKVIKSKHPNFNYSIQEVKFKELEKVTTNQEKLTTSIGGPATAYYLDLRLYTFDNIQKTAFTFVYDSKSSSLDKERKIILFFEKCIYS